MKATFNFGQTTDSIRHKCSSPGAPVPVVIDVSLVGTFTGTASLQVKDMWAPDTTFVTVTTYTTPVRTQLPVAGQKEYRLAVTTAGTGTATAELLSNL